MVKAMKCKVGNPLRKLVLIKLADNSNDQGECWPSYQYIADQCEISKRSVISHIGALINSGLLKKEIRKGGKKGNSSNVYVINFCGAGDSLGGAGDSLGGSAGVAPRISHSFESVKEPIDPEPARKSPTKSTLDEMNIIDVWNELGCARHRGITKKAREAILKTYDEYRKGNSEPKEINEWILAYLKNGFAKWMSNHHRNMGDGQWCADLEFAMRFSTYDKVKNTEFV